MMSMTVGFRVAFLSTFLAHQCLCCIPTDLSAVHRQASVLCLQFTPPLPSSQDALPLDRYPWASQPLSSFLPRGFTQGSYSHSLKIATNFPHLNIPFHFLLNYLLDFLFITHLLLEWQGWTLCPGGHLGHRRWTIHFPPDFWIMIHYTQNLLFWLFWSTQCSGIKYMYTVVHHYHWSP